MDNNNHDFVESKQLLTYLTIFYPELCYCIRNIVRKHFMYWDFSYKLIASCSYLHILIWLFKFSGDKKLYNWLIYFINKFTYLMDILYLALQSKRNIILWLWSPLNSYTRILFVCIVTLLVFHEHIKGDCHFVFDDVTASHIVASSGHIYYGTKSSCI